MDENAESMSMRVPDRIRAETVALVPLNALGAAKTRLRSSLGPQQRRALVAALARHVVTTLSRSAVVDRVVVVSPDPAALDLFAGERGVTLLRGETGGLNADLEQARELARAGGAPRLLVVLGDLPLLSAAAVRGMVAPLDAAQKDGRAAVVLAPDRRGRGTNALALTPPDALPFAFGEGSLARHQTLARAAGVEPLLLLSDATAFDVDTPEDVRELVERGLWAPADLTPSPLP